MTMATNGPGNSAKRHNIKRSVSFYSFQEEYFLREMTLEDIIAKCAELDIPGIEIIGEQMAPGFPDPGEEWFKMWHAAIEKYGRTPVAQDAFLDWNMYKGRVMTADEQYQAFVRDLDFAKRLGCSVVRDIHPTDLNVLARVAEYAEKVGVKWGWEIHAPFHVEHPFTQELWEYMERLGSPYLGFVPDMGMFVKRLPRVITDQWISKGARPEMLEHIFAVYNTHDLAAIDKLPEEIAKMGGGPADQSAAFMTTHMVYTDPRTLLKIMPRVVHIHAKFWEMVDDTTEYSIPYEEIVPVLIEGGYNGYLSSEYEGQRNIEFESIEQVRRQQTMLKKLLGEVPAAEPVGV